mgnify:FL=1
MSDNIQNLFDQLKSEEDKDKKENSTDTNNIDNLFNSLGQPAITSSPIKPFTPSSFTPSVNLEEIDTTRKMAYGAAQEPAILGSTYRLGKAALQSAFSEETFDQASKRIERERQEEIFDDFPEFRGLSEQREDAAILSGRVGLALADPITFLVPWTKIAKSGKIAVAATGAGVTTADVALREKTLYGDIDPTTLAIAGTIGGGSSLLGDVVARKFGRGTLSDKEIADLEDVTPTALSQPYVQKSVMALQDAPNNGQEVNDLNKIRYAYLDALKLKRSMRGGEYKSLEGKKKSVEKNIAGKEKQYRKELEELRVKPAVLRDDQKMKLVSKEELDKLRQAPARKVSTTYTPLSKIREAVVAKERGIVKKQINQSEVLNKELSKLYNIDEVLKQPLEELDSLYARVGVKSYDELKEAAKDAKQALSSKYAEMHQQANNMANVGMSPLYELNKKGNLTENLTRSIMSEITRPLFGGGVGFGLGAAFGDEDDSALMWGLTLGGITVGALQKRIQASNFSFSNKSAANDVLDQQLRRSILTTLKISTAGSTAARMSAYGGPLDTASKLLFKQQGATLKGKASLAVEEREMLAIQEYSRVINEEVLPFIDDDLALAAGKLQNKFITEEDVFAQFAEDKARKVLLYRDNIQKFTNQIADSVDDVGIVWNRLDENEVYGLTQMWDWKAIHKSPNEFRAKLYKAIAQQQSLHPLRDSRRIEKIADEFTASLSGLQTKTVFDKNKKKVIIPLTKNFEKKRILTDQKSRLLMQDFLINDPRLTLQTLVNNTTKSVEFARTFGPNGELLKSIRQQVYNKYNKVDSKGIRGRKLQDKELKQLNDSIDGYFGLYQADQKWSETGQTTMALLTGLANSTMLTRVALPSLGDLIQPLQNSGFMPVIKAYGKQFREGKTFADQGLGIKYSSQIENELRALQFGVDPNNVWQKGIADLNRKFFQIVQLERITNYARAKAYDAGVYRAFAISKKKKVKGSLKTEADALGIGENELQVLRQFKNAEEAYKDAVGKKILHVAGFKSAERDAIIPTVGNRLLFAQSNNPAIRALGQFLSWAQAKTTQTNALLKRIEDGDGKQAVRMLAALSLYGGVRELQIELSPSSYYEDEANIPERFSKKWIGQAVTLSGNVPFQVDKIANAVAGPGAISPVSQMVPVLSLMDDLVRLPVKGGKNILADDYVGAASNVLDVTPFGKDFRQILNNAGISEAALGSKLVDEPNVDKGSNIDRMFKSTGGAIGDEYKVDDVPYVKEDSKERVNPFTGEPYTAIYERDRVALGVGGPLSKIIKNAYDDLGIDEKFITKWRADKDIEVKIKEEQSGLPQRVERNNEVVAAANKLKEGDIKQDEYIGVVREQMPIKLAKEVPPMPTNVEIAAALKSDQVEKGILNVNTKLKQNELVGLRLDIPAYNQYDTWIVSIHDGTKTSGKAKAYAQTGWIKDVEFKSNPLAAFNIATSKPKTTIGRMFGKWKKHDPEFLNKKARELLNDPEWTQVGFNPYRHSYFYEKATGAPVVSASEVIQVGPLVLAKNIKKTKPTDKQFEVDRFFKKGEGKKFNFNDGGLATDEIEEHLIYKMLGS